MNTSITLAETPAQSKAYFVSDKAQQVATLVVTQTLEAVEQLCPLVGTLGRFAFTCFMKAGNELRHGRIQGLVTCAFGIVTLATAASAAQTLLGTDECEQSAEFARNLVLDAAHKNLGLTNARICDVECTKIGVDYENGWRPPHPEAQYDCAIRINAADLPDAMFEFRRDAIVTPFGVVMDELAGPYYVENHLGEILQDPRMDFGFGVSTVCDVRTQVHFEKGHCEED